MWLDAIIKRTSGRVIGVMEWLFYKWGIFVARNPIKVIIACLIITSLCGVALFFKFQSKSDVNRLWIPEGSDFLKVTAWQRGKWKGRGGRHQYVYTTHKDNILTQKGMLKILEVHKVFNSTPYKGAFSDLCLRIPIRDLSFAPDSKRRRRKRQIDGDQTDPTVGLTPVIDDEDDIDGEGDEYDGDDEFDKFLKEQGIFTGDTELNELTPEATNTIDDLPAPIYCDIVETLRDFCGQAGIMTLFNYNEDLIRSMTDQDIVNIINTSREKQNQRRHDQPQGPLWADGVQLHGPPRLRQDPQEHVGHRIGLEQNREESQTLRIRL